MSQYSPQYRASNYPRINRTLTKAEYDQVIDYAIDLGLNNVFIQELESQGHYLPDFAQESPFDSTL
jgi:putative pyruvate formate lyase activating enzyme